MTDRKGASVALMITRDGMGRADGELAKKLIQNYLGLLDLENRLPRAICFYGEGVKLVVEASPVLEELETLCTRGVDVIACGTCLNFLGLAGKQRSGRQGTMRDIMAAQWDCEKVITL